MITSYRDILKLSIPIMIGSAVQNLITLTDTIFLGRVGEVELGAIGLVGVFYLMIASIGYSFSKAGQIMIARRVGEEELAEIGVITHSMGAFALFMATILFFFMQFGSRWFFGLFVDSQEIYEACIAYLDYRSIGVFFSYVGVVAVALYTGVARTTVIVYNAIMMGISNMVLNYGLIFGEWGFPEMGIAGAGLASTISEILATSIFIIYLFFDRHAKSYGLLQFPKVDIGIIKAQLKLSTPIVLQSVVGMGSWFIFFILIEDMGETELAISNLMRAVYLLLMIPCWGFASGTNTIVSNLIGKEELQKVFPTVSKVAWLCFIVTMACSSLLLIAPNTMLKIGTDNLFLIEESKRLIWVLLLTLALFSVGAIYFNGLVGTGATNQALLMQVFSVCIYLGYLYVMVELINCSLELAWMGEIYYWIFTLALAIWYLRSSRWHNIKV